MTASHNTVAAATLPEAGFRGGRLGVEMDPFEKEIMRAIDHPDAPEGSEPDDNSARGPARMLLVAPPAQCELSLISSLESRGDHCAVARAHQQAMKLLDEDRFELLLLNPALEGDHEALIARLHERSAASKLVLVSAEPDVQSTIRGLQLGAVDFIQTPIESEELHSRIGAALKKARAEQRRENRLVRLKAICHELNQARQAIAEQLDALCDDMTSAYEDMNAQISEVAMASEFRTLIRQELDIEDLLRTSLEYVLAKIGPTNAAVFLAEDGGNYSLGAYVNYECPRETIAEVLEGLGSAVCPQLANETELVSFQDVREFSQWLGIDAGMLGESEVIAFPCRHEDECLAVIVLFRSATKPFGPSLGPIIEMLRPIFAAQLSNIVRIHHRALPSWPKEPRDEVDEYDLNNDEYGFGGLAA